MNNPFMVAVSGGSGSGKTTFVNALADKLGTSSLLILSLDDYYRDLSHLKAEERSRVNFDDPKAIELELLKNQVETLRRGESVSKPLYDFATHTRRAESQLVEPAGLIVLDGIFSLCYPELYALLDLKIFIDVDPDIRVVRRIGRDMEQRGRSFAGSADQYLGSVKAMHAKYIEPSKHYADFVIPWHRRNEPALQLLSKVIKLELSERR